MAKAKRNGSNANGGKADAYRHPTADSPMRPEVGTQPQFKKRKPPKTYRYDSSLSPALDWDTNPAREQGEKLIADILNAKTVDDAKTAASSLKGMSKPFLNWAGKAERLSFDIPTLPLFIHERLSTKAIMETIQDKKRDKQMELDLFADPKHSVTDQILKAYEHRDKWVNRMILGDSLVVMNSLLEYENMAGKVQMIYMDPPYGVKFGSNFQPFVRKRDVKHNDDESMTREPEMIQAYRDTWELGTHSYLTYLRDRFITFRALLNSTGSLFVQISDENLHHVRELLDEVFGSDNFCSVISIKKTSGLGATLLQSTQDFLLWYAKDRALVKYRQIYVDKVDSAENDSHYQPDDSGRLFMADNLTAQNNDVASCIYEYEFKGDVFRLPPGRQWKTTKPGMDRLAQAGRLIKSGKSLRYKRYVDDFPVSPITDTWHDIGGSVQSRSDPKVYVVQTGTNVVQRCVLMTTDPGELVLDPTCGSGTTAFVSETWGRRWITVDTSRVPLALARQRLLTSTFSYYELKDEKYGPIGGFVYRRKKNTRGVDVGGIVPHITLKSFATNEDASEEVLIDKPETLPGVTRVTGPFVFEATIPVPIDGEASQHTDTMEVQGEEPATFVERMMEVLRRSPTLKISAKHEIKLKDIRRPAKTLALSAEAIAVNGKENTVAFVFGPENGSISEKLVYEAAKEAEAKKYSQLIAVGFAIEPNARLLIDKCEEAIGIPAMYVQATPDLMMGDLLKTMRSSQIFSVCGLPDFKIKKLKPKSKSDPVLYQVVLEGLDTFDATSMETSKLDGNDVPAWFLDTDYNNLVFHVDQAFFPRTSAWDGLKKALKGTYDDDVWAHLAGDKSALFEGGENNQIAIKVIDDRGNELVAVRSLKEAE